MFFMGQSYSILQHIQIISVLVHITVLWMVFVLIEIAAPAYNFL